MAVDQSRANSKGGDSQYDTGSLRGVREERGIVTGIVKANVHGAHMGVIRIWVPTFCTDPDDKTQYRTVRYCTPFYSRVDNQGVGDTYFGTKVTSGIVTPPPDIGTKVLAFFPEGRNAEGYYFACVPDTFMLQTVPEATLYNGVASGEFNDNLEGERSSKKVTNWKTQARPQDFFTNNQLSGAGLVDDTVRGLNNSSYMRESPSEVLGISSKGRRITTAGQDFTLTYNAQIKDPNTTDKTILNGLLGPTGRRKGHSITLDDGDIDGNSNQIRLRTSTGHQILLNDSEGVIYVGNGEGTAWIELGSQGTMDVYALDSINFRSKNLNFHADENIKFHSKGYSQFVSEKQMHVEGKEQLVMNSAGEAGITGEKGLHLNTTGELFASSGGASYLNAGGNMSIAGSLILLQGPSTKAKTAKNISELQKIDVSYASGTGFEPGKEIATTADRIVTHEPFPGHGQKNITSPYTGGLVGGGGGMGGAFSVIGGLAGGAIPTGLDGGLAAAAASVGGGGAISQAVSAVTSGGAGNILSQATNVLGSSGLASNVLSQVSSSGAGNVLGQLTGGGANPLGALTSSLQGGQLSGLADTFTSTIGGANLPGFDSIASSLGGITSNLPIGDITSQLGNLPIGDIQNQLSSVTSQLAGADLGKLVTDSTGKITGIADSLGAGLPDIQGALSTVAPQLQDALPSVLNSPALKKFPVTDMVAQVNTGFSIGALDSFDMQGLNAAVVKQVGSLNNPKFIDGITKSVGKYGFNVDQLKSQGFVRPDAIFNDQLADTSVWTGKGGANSLNKFLGNSGLQEQVQQAVVATDYQKMFNTGAIKLQDGKKEIMGMLTASNISSPEIASKVRQGFSNIEDTLKNTTNIPDGEDVSSVVKDAMQTGAAAQQRVEKIKEPTPQDVNVIDTVRDDQGNVTQETVVRTGVDEDGFEFTETVTDQFEGETYSAPSAGPANIVGDARQGRMVRDARQDIYQGKNGQRIKSIDDTVMRLEEILFSKLLDGTATREYEQQARAQINALGAERDLLVKDSA